MEDLARVPPLSSIRSYHAFFDRRIPGFGFPFAAAIAIALLISVLAIMIVNFQRQEIPLSSVPLIEYSIQQLVSCLVTTAALVWLSYNITSGWLLVVLFGCMNAYFDQAIQFATALVRSSSSSLDWRFMLLGVAWGICVPGAIILAIRLAGLRLFVTIISAVAGWCLYQTASRFLLAPGAPIDWFEVALRSSLGGVVIGVGFYAGLRTQYARMRRFPLAAEAPTPSGERISKKFFIASCGIGLFVGLPLALAGASSRDAAQLAFQLAVGALLILFAVIVFLVLVHRMWAAIQDGSARTSPGKAVGLCFVPVFNLYWIFQVFPGFATDYNAYLDRHSLPAPRLGRGLFIAYPILCILGAIPFLGIILAIVTPLIGLMIVGRACDAINALPTNAVDPATAAG